MSTSIPIPLTNLIFPILASGLILIFWPAEWTGLSSFMWSTPVIILASFTLAYRLGDSSFSWLLTGFFLLIPSVGVTFWSRQLILIDLPYLLPHESVPHFLTLVQRVLSPIPPILLSAWVSSLWCKSPPTRLFIGLSTFAAIIAKHYIDSASISLHLGDYQNAAHQLSWVEFLRIIPLAGLIVVWRHHNKLERVLLIMMSFICAWLVGPPLWLYLYQIPVPSVSDTPPIGQLGTTAGVPSADPNSPTFSEDLNAQGLERLSGWPWWCNTEPRKDWDNNRGATAILRLNANAHLSTLETVLPDILYRGVTRLGFVGLSKTDVPFPLDAHLKHPIARLLIGPPPDETYWGEIIGTQAYFYKSIPSDPIACALWVPPDVTVGTLFDVSQTLDQVGGICERKLFMAFGAPPIEREVWRAPLPCHKAK